MQLVRRTKTVQTECLSGVHFCMCVCVCMLSDSLQHAFPIHKLKNAMTPSADVIIITNVGLEVKSNIVLVLEGYRNQALLKILVKSFKRFPCLRLST